MVRFRRSLPAPPATVFAAWTDPTWVARWMCPVSPDAGEPSPVEAWLDLRVGGRFRIAMEIEGTTFVHEGEYLEITPPTRLVFTWRVPLESGPRLTRVTVDLQPADGGTTEMELLHERLPDADLRDAHAAGWHAIGQRLIAHLHRHT